MKPTLLILAAGIGSRYGGLKQVDGFGPAGETILDYSIYDAINSGFEKIVFVIREEIEKEIKDIYASRWGDKVELDYVYQELTDLPGKYKVPVERVKPWGTGHAIWTARNNVSAPFLVINADDFYGRSSYRLAFKHLNKAVVKSQDSYCNVGYILTNTLSEHGFVSRAECTLDNEGKLVKIVERLKINKSEGGIFYEGPDGTLTTLSEDTVVSMNMWGFLPTFFSYLEDKMLKFLEDNIDDIKAEYLLPSIVDELLEANAIQVKVPISNERWFGITYKEDKSNVIKQLKKLVDDGLYPSPLG